MAERVCVFHTEDTPSLSFNSKKRVFHCFGCQAAGTLWQFLERYKGMSKTEAFAYINKAINGSKTEYRDPDSKAEAIYHYHDEKYKPVKKVLRFPGKRFQQRRADGTEWLPHAKGVKPLLYKLPYLQFASTVFLTEGEKDADRVHALRLLDCYGSEVVGTTSGSATSWNASLAGDLVEKRVVIFRDSDEAGRKYAENVSESLRKRGIEHVIVSFVSDKVNDVSDYLLTHTTEDLLSKIGKQEWFQNTEPESVLEA